ncbi:MAG: phenylalanyl-tRNA synthetase alpha chain [Chloroflexota bacterium]|nr:phenylalanyl-tRNA synthetase alpha chain [Chloroflexota bacterium]
MSEKSSLISELEALQAEAEQELAGLTSESDLQNWRSQFLGRSAMVIQIFRRLPEAPKEERPAIGQFANQVKNALEEKLAEKMEAVQASELQRSLEVDSLDVTLPGRKPPRGRLHIQTKVTREVCRIFGDMGFLVFQSPEVESDDYNFELLNIPAHHPARDMWDTFFTTDENVVLRTHTSPGEIHAMKSFFPDPIRVTLPGMCFRYEQTDASHEIQFNQLELLVVGKDITFAHLKGTLEEFAKRMFGRDVRTRFRPSYFPFTEPSAEMDVECFVCGGKGCPACGNKGWLEICGCGLTHPVVLANGGYDPDVYTGFAAGLGIERISMLRYRIDDIRNFWRNDVRFLEQF